METEDNVVVERISLIHEFVLDENHVCSYPRGRGQYGLIFAVDGEAEVNDLTLAEEATGCEEFIIDGCHVEFFGICKKCQDSNSDPKK